MTIPGNGPWTVTVWLNDWPGTNKQRIQFEDISYTRLKNELNKALNKPKRTQVLRKYISPNMVRFEIRSGK